ncbi:primosomal protein N' [Anaerosalibacter bizertensis]|uniref:primosomal protein N' n=1 Tax=Anaerosalibacter bizertensis TaxID=932217 RepID=UPI001C0F1867|nr:primosomal protein N' [Anaerosalibacter bizertensis]MBU5293355.1 primosomal protein N' [Anaerosalibacter bizertensis]
MSTMVAKVIVDNRSSKTDKPYTYAIKKDMEEDLKQGMRVLVPFGRGNRYIKGLVIKIEKYNGNISKLKYIKDLLDDKPIISEKMLELSLWMKENYLSSYLDSLYAVMPPGDFKKINTYIYINDKQSFNMEQISPKEKNIISILNDKKKVSFSELKKEVKDNNIRKYIKKLEEKGIILTSLEIETKIHKKYEKYITLKNDNMKLEEILSKIDNRAFKQQEVIKFLYEAGEISLKKLLKETNTSNSVVKSLEKKGEIKIIEKEVLRSPIPNGISQYKKHKLTDKQEYCLNEILDTIRNEEGNKFLIHGVTGSGKTEIYLQLIENLIKSGKQAIVLVPEISLTPQTVERFVGRFGQKVAVLHSRLSYGERFDEWRRIKEGKVNIVVGARSAVFAPFNNLGLIIIDEEHENSYKSSMNPKYNAIEVAEKRCELEGASLVLGTATPSLETYYRAKSGEIKLLTLSDRINNKKLPTMNIVDMREELNSGNRSILSVDLYDAIEENLKNNKQTILFLNRRGYSTFISCRKCGYVAKCENCDISLTYHFSENKLKCHYCGMVTSPPRICPECGSKYIKYFGSGTQKIEEIVKKLFPYSRIARMDVDTTSRKGSHARILKNMKNGEIDILIGTQMITKGLDFPLVTLVGIIAADTSLNLPDFRSSERTFQLLTQVGGRAGRGDFEGQVIVQTYSPEHFSIQMAKEHDYIQFYNKEILLRKEFEYPPFMDIITIVMYGRDRNKVSKLSKKIYSKILEKLKEINKGELAKNIFGPNPAPLEKLKNNYRWQIIIKSDKENLKMLKNVVSRVCIYNSQNKEYKDIKFSIDVNPNSIL